MPSINHIHTLKRIPKSQPYGGQWRCMDVYCTFRAPTHEIKDKASKCCYCNAEIIMDYDNRQRAKPNCLNCRNSKKSKQIHQTEEMLKELGI